MTSMHLILKRNFFMWLLFLYLRITRNNMELVYYWENNCKKNRSIVPHVALNHEARKKIRREKERDKGELVGLERRYKIK